MTIEIPSTIYNYATSIRNWMKEHQVTSLHGLYLGNQNVIERSWGQYQVLVAEAKLNRYATPGFLVKKLTFAPSAAMDYQRHFGRMEKWVCVSGYGTMTLAGTYPAPMGTDLHHMARGNTQHVPIEMWHKFVAGPHGCTIIETWIGDDLREEDIER